MKLENASITMLINRDYTEIVIQDDDANCDFVRVKITPDQLSSMLSRMGNTPCEVHVLGLEKIGKKHEWEVFVFEIPKELRSRSNSGELQQLAISELEKVGKSEWKPDSYFGSQDSFFSSRDNKEFARVTIRRWVDPIAHDTAPDEPIFK